MTTFHFPDAGAAADDLPPRAASERVRFDRTIPIWGVAVAGAAALLNAGILAFALGGQAERLNVAEAAGQQVRALDLKVAQIDQRTTDMQGDLHEIRKVLDAGRRP